MQGRGDFRCALLRPSSSVACQIDELVMKQEQKGKAWTKVKPARRGWWRTPLIPKLRKQRQVDLLWVWGQPDLYSEFQDIPNCIKRLYPKTNKQTKTTPTTTTKKNRACHKYKQNYPLKSPIFLCTSYVMCENSEWQLGSVPGCRDGSTLSPWCCIIPVHSSSWQAVVGSAR